MSANVDFDELKKEFDEKFVAKMFYEDKKEFDIFWSSTVKGTEWDEDMNLKHISQEDEIDRVKEFITNALNQQRRSILKNGKEYLFWAENGGGYKDGFKKYLDELKGRKGV